MSQKTLAKVLGENIAGRRRELGLSQMVLAERLNIGQDALSRMENGMISPKISRLRDVATVLDCSVSFLFREQGAEPDYFADLAEVLNTLRPEQREKVIRAIREVVKVVR
jgi:transcriptional regulator with XRE-family HTH domain